MNERIRLVRKHYGISQTDFGKQIGVKLGVIKNLEQGKTELKSPLFELFCSVYKINPDWLSTGEGEMFCYSPNTRLNELADALQLSEKSIDVLRSFAKLSKSEQDTFIDLAEKILLAKE